MKKRKLFLRAMRPGEWGVIGPSDTLLHGTDTFEMDLYCDNPDFYYVTENSGIVTGKAPLLKVDNEEPVLSFPVEKCPFVSALPGIILKVLFCPRLSPTGTLAEPYSTEIAFRSPEKYLEYIFLSRNNENERQLELREAGRKITFMPGERIEYMGKTGWCYRSEQKMPLRKHSDMKIQLSEILGTGKRILIKQLPEPVPGMFIDAPSGVVRTLLYI